MDVPQAIARARAEKKGEPTKDTVSETLVVGEWIEYVTADNCSVSDFRIGRSPPLNLLTALPGTTTASQKARSSTK